MFLSVLTKNLNWKILTKNYLLIILLWAFTEKCDFLGGQGVHELKVDGGGRGGGGEFSDLRGKGVKKRGGILSPSFWKTGCMR